ncbi:MAG: hypothetical protein IIZ40_04690 [Bacilli bacterium]|nr:hypothetical protein [Bacilli bacterium]
MENNLKKNFIFNTLGATIYSFTSLFYMIIATRIVGTKDAGLFTFAFSTANLLQVIGVYAGRTYQVTENNENITDSDYFYNRIISCSFILIIGLLFCFLEGYAVFKIGIILLLIVYKMLDAFAEHYYAILQKNDDLYKVGISLIIKGVLGVVLFLLINILTKNIFLACTFLVLLNLIVTFTYDYLNSRKEKQVMTKLNLKNVCRIYLAGFWIFIQTFLMQYILNASRYSIDNYFSDDYQTIFGIILMPASLMMLVSQFIIQPYLIRIKDYIAKKEFNSLNKLILKICIFILIIGALSLVAAYFLGIPVLELVYNLKLKEYKSELLVIITASIIYSISFILNNVLIALRKTLAPAICYLTVAIIEFFLVNHLVLNYALFGASIAYFISMLLILLIYIIIYFIEVRKEIQNG